MYDFSKRAYHRKIVRLLWIEILIVAGVITSSACAPQQTLEQRHHDANTPAGKVGQAAHKAAVQLDKAGRVVGRQLNKAAHDAHEGWKESARKDQQK